MFSTDYPHAEGGRDPIARFETSLAQHGDETRERFFRSNFTDLVRD
jgi:predicted TIM-barrel fold metal-dependent hydrolase